MPLPSLSDTGPSLLDKSTAKPGSVDMSIFEKKHEEHAASKSQGAVNSKYLEECRRDNPSPAEEKTAKRTVTLSDCRIDTSQEDLATDQPFKMSCVATSSDGKPVTSGVTFRLYCTLPDGTEEDTGLAKVGKREGDRICAEGMLYSPKKLVEWGEVLKYRVVAEHGDPTQVISSSVKSLVSRPFVPVEVWSLGESYFQPHTAFILPQARERFNELSKVLLNNPGTQLAIFGHCDSEPNAIENQDLAGRRAYAIYCALTRFPDGWLFLDKGVDGDNWIIDCVDIIRNALSLARVDVSGSEYDIYARYIDFVCGIVVDEARFTLSDSKTHDRCSCFSCGERNKLFQSSEPAKLQYNGRITVAITNAKRHKSGIPCSSWSSFQTRCKIKPETGCGFYDEIRAVERNPAELVLSSDCLPSFYDIPVEAFCPQLHIYGAQLRQLFSIKVTLNSIAKVHALVEAESNEMTVFYPVSTDRVATQSKAAIAMLVKYLIERDQSSFNVMFESCFTYECREQVNQTIKEYLREQNDVSIIEGKGIDWGQANGVFDLFMIAIDSINGERNGNKKTIHKGLAVRQLFDCNAESIVIKIAEVSTH